MLCLGKTALSNQGGHVRIVSGVFQYGPIVYRLVHRPVTADGGVRFPLGPPVNNKY